MAVLGGTKDQKKRLNDDLKDNLSSGVNFDTQEGAFKITENDQYD